MLIRQKKRQKEGKSILFNNDTMTEFSLERKNGNNLKESTNSGDAHVTKKLSYRSQKESNRDDVENKAMQKRNLNQENVV